jgi:CO dehydrogenase maturation factor
MKIAFVGKGGSGKTTVSSLLAQYLAESQPVLAIDADINMHMAELFAVKYDSSKVISEKVSSNDIRTYLRGTNSRITSNDTMKKSTPPGSGSNLVTITHEDDWFMKKYAYPVSKHMSCVVVGTYSEDGIGSSCYHNNLAILENVLSHASDEGSIVVDMVAGTDAFASTLFAQFDALFFVVEPTTRSLAVYSQYEKLAARAGVGDRLYAIGNKIESDQDAAFIERVSGKPLIAALSRSSHLLAVDKGQTMLDAKKLDTNDRRALEKIKMIANKSVISSQERLPHLWELHKNYVAQSFVKDRFGDLTSQIDELFKYPSA